MRRTPLLPLMGVLILGSFSAAARPTVPDAVRRAVAEIFGGPRPVEREREAEGDRYEVKTRSELAVVLDAAGAVVEVEATIPPGLVPPAVLAAARAALPGSRVVEAELLVRGSQVLYEIEARGAGGEVELVIDAGGALVSRAVEAGRDDEDD